MVIMRVNEIKGLLHLSDTYLGIINHIHLTLGIGSNSNQTTALNPAPGSEQQGQLITS